MCMLALNGQASMLHKPLRAWLCACRGARWSLLGAAAASGLLQGGGRGGHAPPVMEAEPSLERIVHAVQLQPGPAMLRPVSSRQM